MSITQIRLDTQAQDATLIPSKISTSATDDFTFPRDVIATSRTQVGLGSASLPSLTFSSDTNTGIFNQAADSIGVAAGGTEYLRINPSRVQAFNAIRTKSGGSASAPDLEVGSATTGIFNSTGGSDFNITVGSSTKLAHNGVQWETFSPVRFTSGSAGVAAMGFTGDPDTGLFSPGANIIGFTTNSTEQMRIDTSAVTASIPFRGADGSAGSPTHSFSSSTNTGMYIVSTNLFFSTGGTTQLGIVNAGQLQARDGSVGAPTFSFFNDTDTGFTRTNSNAIEVVMGGTSGFTFNKEGATSNYQLFANVPGIVTRPVYSNSGSSTTGIYFPSSSVGVTVGGSEKGRFTSTGLTVTGDTSVTGVVKTSDGTAAAPSHTFTSDPDSGLYSASANNPTIAAGGVPIAIFTSDDIGNGFGGIVLDGSMGIAMGVGQIMGAGTNDPTQPAIAVTSNTNSGGLTSPTGTTLGVVAAGAEVFQATANGIEVSASHKILNVDGSLGAPSYTFVNDTTSGIFRGSFPEVTIVAGGLDIADFRTTMIRAHKNLQMNSNNINTVSVISVANGSNSAPSYTFDSAPATGMFLNDPNEISFTAGGVQVMDVGTSEGGLVMEGGFNISMGTGSVVIADTGTSGAPSITFGGSAGFFADGAGISTNSDFTIPTDQVLNFGLATSAEWSVWHDSAGTALQFTWGGGTNVLTIDDTVHNLNVNSHKITNLLDPTGDQDAATKSYVDSVAAGLDPKASSRVATAAALPSYTTAGSGGTHTLTATANGVLTVDGVSSGWTDIDNNGGSRNPMVIPAASRVLVKNAVLAKDNGIYAVKAKGDATHPFILIRATDQDGTPANEVSGGNFSFVEEGTANSDTGWTVSSNGNIVVETDNIDWIQFSAAGAIIAGTGLTQSGATINANAADASITMNADDFAVHRDIAGAIGLTGSGIKVNVDGSSIEINTNAIRVKAAGITYAMTNIVTRETPSGTVDGVNVTFTLAFTPASGSEHVYLNGVLQDVGGGNDYTISGPTITFAVAPVTGSKVRVSYWKA